MMGQTRQTSDNLTKHEEQARRAAGYIDEPKNESYLPSSVHGSPSSIDPIFDLPKFILSAVTIYCICDVIYLYVDTLQINITNLLFLISL